MTAKRKTVKAKAPLKAPHRAADQGLALLLEEVAKRKKMVHQYLREKDRPDRFRPDDIYRGVHSYLGAGGKSLRPAVLLFSCGAAGGSEERALPAAAAIEVYHTWTLVHDDIIDRDPLRRGIPTVHESIKRQAMKRLGLREAEASHYGLSMAVLAGDLQQGWTISLLTELAKEKGVNPILVLQLILDLEVDVQCALIEGEALDVLYSKLPVQQLTEEKIIDMLWKKTGALYQFAGRAGAMIGVDQPNPRHQVVEALSAFASNCGIAFQLQDDILGITGDQRKLGKPVGSDIREGKRTVIIHHALGEAGAADRRVILRTLGNPKATAGDARRTARILEETGSLAYTAELAQKYVRKALAALEPLPISDYKKLLLSWANYMINREF